MQVGLLGRFLPWGGASPGPPPSPEPALGLHVAAPAASQHLSLLVLTAGSLDKWQVGTCFASSPSTQCSSLISW